MINFIDYPEGVMMKQLNKLMVVLKETQKQVELLLADKSKLLNKRLMTQNLTGKLILQQDEIVAIISDTNYTDIYEWISIFEEWIFKEGVYETQGQGSFRADPILKVGETILDQLNYDNFVDQSHKDERHAS